MYYCPICDQPLVSLSALKTHAWLLHLIRDLPEVKGREL